MVTSVQQVVQRLDEGGFVLRRATPRNRDHLSIEAWRASTLHGGQWHRDPGAAERAAALVRSSFGEDSTVTLVGSGVVLHRDGADAELPGLRTCAGQPGAVLLSHRVGRRGVVRTAGGDFTKVVRPKALTRLVGSLTELRLTRSDVPRIRSVDHSLGAITTCALPGTTLSARLADPTLEDDRLAADLHHIGAALRELHAQPPPDRPRHDATAELAAARRWLEAASEHDLIPERRWLPVWEQAVQTLAHPTTPAVCVHRDLHDKQVTTGDARAVGLLDLDLMCPGEAGLDLGNLIAHLHLRALKGHCSTARAEACAQALLEGYAPDRHVRESLPGYVLTTRLRLAAVYSFRAARPTVIDGLLRAGRDRELVP